MNKFPLSRKTHDQTHLHFIGVGGIGMSGIAEVFANQGYQVSGSDLKKSDTTDRLAKLGVKIFEGHQAKNVDQADVIVQSSAVQPSNVEIQAAKEKRIPVIPRAEMLAELMRGRKGVAVAGSHGKTTTTSLLATVLTECELDPTIVNGGKVDSLGGNAKLGRGDYLVAEADESDGSFLKLPAQHCVITNIDNDHLDFYGSIEKVDEAFIQFVGNLPFYGSAAVCAEDVGVQRCLNRFTKPVITYGFDSKWDYYASDLKFDSTGTCFQVWVNEDEPKRLGEVKLNFPGKHNVLNALSTVVVGRELGLGFDQISKALSVFNGVKRRFEICWKEEGEPGRVIVDDYGHHPTEIQATLEAAKRFWAGKVKVVFQPHRYSRTLHCMDGFLSAFDLADEVMITDIYAAGEEPIEGVSSELLVQKLLSRDPEKRKFTHVSTLEEARDQSVSSFQNGDLIVCMGAGTITKLPAMIKDKL